MLSKPFQFVTIPFSHYCEKARWALDLTRVPYRESGFLPGAHLLATAARGRGKTVPMLMAHGRCYADSSAIVHFANEQRLTGVPSLFGTSQPETNMVSEIEQDISERLGPATRQLAYFHLLRDPKLLVDLVKYSYRPLLRPAFTVVMPLLSKPIAASYQADAAGAADAERTIKEIFAEIDRRLGDHQFVATDFFSAADIALAALAAPVLLWPEATFRSDRTRIIKDPIHILPESFANTVRTLRMTPTAKHCLNLYNTRRY